MFLKKFIDNKNDFGFIAKINNKIVGFAFGYILLKPDGRKVIDCYKMYLITNRSNISACKCYEKAGGINKTDDEVVYVYDSREEN